MSTSGMRLDGSVITGERIQTNFGVRPPEQTLLMSRMTKEPPAVTTTEMYRKVILIQLMVPSYSSAISFTDFIYPYCCTCLSTRPIFLGYAITILSSLDLQLLLLNFLHLNCDLLRFILFPYVTTAQPSPDDCPISFSELQSESSALGKDIRGVIESFWTVPSFAPALSWQRRIRTSPFLIDIQIRPPRSPFTPILGIFNISTFVCNSLFRTSPSGRLSDGQSKTFLTPAVEFAVSVPRTFCSPRALEHA